MVNVDYVNHAPFVTLEIPRIGDKVMLATASSALRVT